MDKVFELAYILLKPVYSQYHCYHANANFWSENEFFLQKLD